MNVWKMAKGTRRQILKAKFKKELASKSVYLHEPFGATFELFITQKLFNINSPKVGVFRAPMLT